MGGKTGKIEVEDCAGGFTGRRLRIILECEQQQLLQDLDPYDLVHLSPASHVCLSAFFSFSFPVTFPSPLV